jgi:cyanate permease
MIVKNSTTVGFEATMTTVGYCVLAVIAAAVGSLALLGRPKMMAGTSSSAPPFSMLAVLRRGRFWKIALAAAIGLGGQVGLLAHQVPMISMHLDQVTASLMVTVVAIASAAGRLLVGVFSRYLSISGLAAASYILHGAGIGLLAFSTDVAGIMTACALAGLVVGAIVMLPPMLVREAFGTAGFGRTYAMVNVVMYVLAGLSPWIVGMLRDASGSYSSGLLMLVAMEAVAAIILLWPPARNARP